jgi:hypothetical protein
MTGRVLLVALALLLGVAPPSLAAAEDRTELVELDAAGGTRVITAKVRGQDTATYLVPAAAGQSISVRLETNHRQTHFDVFAPDGSQVFDGASSGASYESPATLSGQYSVRVKLARGAAFRREVATIQLALSVTGVPAGGADMAAGEGAAAAPPAEGAAKPGGDAEGVAKDGESAAPAPDPAEFTGSVKFWAVTGVPTSASLPVQEEPGDGTPSIGQFAADETKIANLGCRMVAEARWCRVPVKTEQGKKEGWVPGRYLREDSGRSRENIDRSGRGLRIIIGKIDCSQSGTEKPEQKCEVRVQQAEPGLAVAYVTMPDGATRSVNFAGGKVFVPGRVQLKWKRDGMNYVVALDDTEMMVIPVAVIGDHRRVIRQPPVPNGDPEPAAPPQPEQAAE